MPNRGKFQGVAQIFAYNRTFYIVTLGAIGSLLALAAWLPPIPGRLSILFLIGAVFWVLSSLAVSHWIYDRSQLYSLNWLSLRSGTWLNVHAGLDEMTDLLKIKFPEVNYQVFDIFDPAEMTEPSIARARALAGNNEAQQVSWKQLPAGDRAFDAIFLPFVAHEFRSPPARHLFFQELARVLAANGKIVLVEHLRDLPNFLAFGPGFFHFQSRRTWSAAFNSANLCVSREFRITPFVHVFELEPNNLG